MFDYLFDVSSQPKVAIPKLFFLTLHPSNLSHPFDNGIINLQPSIINHQSSIINLQPFEPLEPFEPNRKDGPKH